MTNSVNTAAGSVRQLSKGPSAGRWQATIVLGEGRGARKRTKTFDTRRAALTWLAETKRDGVAHGYASEQTLAQAVDAYLAAKVLAPNTERTFQALRRRLTAAGLGDRKLGKLRPSVQDQFTSWMVKQGLSGSSVNLYAGKLTAVLRFADRDGGLPFRPSAATVVVHAEDTDVIAPGDVAALYEAAPDGFAPAILLGAFCGLRASEACAVNVGDVDWSAGTLRVSKAVDARGQFCATKTARSMRTIPVPANVLAQLEPHRFRPADAPLATNLDGRRLLPATYLRTFRIVADDAGVDVTSHALRKFFATTMLAAGVNPKAAARWLGDTVEVMLRTYALVRDDDADVARAAIASAFDATTAA
jgi:integrase